MTFTLFCLLRSCKLRLPFMQHAFRRFHSCAQAASAPSMLCRALDRRGGIGMSWSRVYAFVKLIPRGRVMTYGGLAKALSLRGGARSAGRAMAASPSGKGIPWHRVVGFGGKLLIREPYAGLQRRLLESEGVQMTERRVNMKLHAWTPPKKRVRKSKTGKPAARKR
jgi:methylated-DNA-protein-cysteine methyltransferase-like protein